MALVAAALAALIIAALLIWRDDILEAFLDPQVPYTVYKPPPAPDYAKAGAWDQLPTHGESAPVDVFFVHPTTFDGGHNWNGPIGDRGAAALYARVVAPNYAAPFARVGRIFAPRYRQASLYTSLTVFDDAIEAREFAYDDVRAAFDYYLAHLGRDRPFILAGVEQGGQLAARLLSERIAPDPALRHRLVAAYLIETDVAAGAYADDAPIPACHRRNESGCVVAWISARQGDFPRVISILTRSKVWGSGGHLVNLAGAPLLCVNPLLGAEGDDPAAPRLNLGAANATGLEWTARPGFLVRQVGAQCVGGILRVSRPRSDTLLPHGSFAKRLRVPDYNLFWADLEADSLIRATAWRLTRPD
ncbi:MAG TPA: DUF3089 domain-containing protein [Caulobacteraceae bacterium]|nr:DUF3089 domain-containing protein [Caulobacteraceae bacterium]